MMWYFESGVVYQLIPFHGVDMQFRSLFEVRVLLLCQFIEAQFERCLDQLFSVQLSPLETNVLLSKYGSNPQQRGMVCYRDFCTAIDASKLTEKYLMWYSGETVKIIYE